MTAQDQVSIGELKELLRCDAATGRLFWLPRNPTMFRGTKARSDEHACANWNSRYAGTEAFTSGSGNGYRNGRIHDRKYFAHRVIWALVNGCWPQGEIDHIDGDRSNNRINNLREATRSENERNKGRSSANTTGYKGVCRDRASGRWEAYIKLHGKRTFLGRHSTPEKAHAAYVSASKRLHGEFAKVE
jgi:hypothetical protein